MATYGIILSLLHTLLVATVCSASQEPEFNIEKFFNTTELIWTSHSTAREQLPCKVDVKHSINKTSVTFYRAYIDRWARRWRNKTLVGQFRFWTDSSDGGYDSMNLKSTRGMGAGEEAIHYQSGDNKCAVFFVMGHVGSTIQPTYELRVKQPSINVAMYTDCWKEFLNVTVGRRRMPFYHKKCQKAFDPNEDRIRYL